MEFNEAFDTMIELGIATSEELGVACHFAGLTMDAINELLFYKTGYRDLEQYLDYIDEEEEDE